MPNKVIYTGTINGAPVRFFPPQSADDMMPWIAADDLARALGLPRAHRRSLHKSAAKFRDVARTILTDGGRTTILGFQAVQGLMGALEPTGIAYRSDLHQEYVREVTAAARVMFPDLFDDLPGGSFTVKSTSVARLLGADHERVVSRIETELGLANVGPTMH